MNTELVKQMVLEDCQRRLDKVLTDELMKGDEKTGLYQRILKTDRHLLYRAMGKVLDVSQVENNRDELSFFESLNHLFHYYMYDDGVLTIQWTNYNLEEGEWEDAKPDKGIPYLSYGSDDSPKIARETEIHWLLDWHETKNENMVKDMIEIFGSDDDDVKCLEKKSFIDYNG